MARTRGTARRSAGRSRGGARTARRKAPSRRTGGRAAPTPRRKAGPRGPDAARALERQHDLVRGLFRRLAEAEGDERRATFLELADALSAHATVEERLLYPELTRSEEAGALARDAIEEHLVAKRLLADLLEARLSDEVFDAKCRVLEDEVTRHVAEEEAILLPRAQRAVGRERLAALGPEIERTFAELMRHEPRRSLHREAQGFPVLH